MQCPLSLRVVSLALLTLALSIVAADAQEAFGGNGDLPPAPQPLYEAATPNEDPVIFGEPRQRYELEAQFANYAPKLSETSAPAAEPCPCPKCKKKPKPTPNPYKTLFYDNNFNYLENPCNTQHNIGDFMKRRHLGRSVVFDVGGEYRFRHENLNRLSRHDDYLLHRTRIYGNVQVSDWFRIYMEAIDAVTNYEDAPVGPVDENRFDALNLFGDIKFLDNCQGDLWFRGGRQELLYGAQRLVSPLNWGNTRRTFDGFKLYWRGKDWNVDGFWTRPVSIWQHLPPVNTKFDNPTGSQEFAGVYITRQGLKNANLEFFFLRYADALPMPPVSPVNFNYNTLGMRIKKSKNDWHYEFEGGWQGGRYGALFHSAGYATIGGGRTFKCLPMDPVLWVYYDWASGDNNPNDGINTTFNQNFPLGHKYFGWMDLVGRQNIRDFNIRLTMSPHKKVKWIVWWHLFHLDQARDALYNPLSVPIRRDPTGAAGTYVGQELDMLVKFQLRQRTSLTFGYCHLFGGSFLANTGGIGGQDFYYSELVQRF